MFYPYHCSSPLSSFVREPHISWYICIDIYTYSIWLLVVCVQVVDWQHRIDFFTSWLTHLIGASRTTQYVSECLTCKQTHSHRNMGMQTVAPDSDIIITPHLFRLHIPVHCIHTISLPRYICLFLSKHTYTVSVSELSRAQDIISLVDGSYIWDNHVFSAEGLL